MGFQSGPAIYFVGTLYELKLGRFPVCGWVFAQNKILIFFDEPQNLARMLLCYTGIFCQNIRPKIDLLVFYFCQKPILKTARFNLG